MANNASWNNVYKRINSKRKEAGLTWNQLASKAGIRMGTWMTGLPSLVGCRLWGHIESDTTEAT